MCERDQEPIDDRKRWVVRPAVSSPEPKPYRDGEGNRTGVGEMTSEQSRSVRVGKIKNP